MVKTQVASSKVLLGGAEGSQDKMVHQSQDLLRELEDRYWKRAVVTRLQFLRSHVESMLKDVVKTFVEVGNIRSSR
jgi:hypothetical protein